MKRRSFLFLILLGLFSVVLFRLTRGAPEGMYAHMRTSRGKIVLKLHYDKVPVTVANFVALAEGSHGLLQEDRKGIPFYDGLTFHKLIPEVMIQGGDPKGTGNGGPGFRFARELSPDLRHDRPGILSMLNEGSFSHGSQFFITLKATPRYDDRHTIFGEVVEGLSVAEQLVEGDTLERLSIRRHGKDAAAFNPTEHLEALGRSARQAEEEAARFASEATQRSLGSAEKPSLPQLTGKTDPARVPKANQPEAQKIALEYLLVSHKDAVLPVGRPTRDREEARNVARHLTAVARETGRDFEALAREFSDSAEYRIPLLLRDSETSAVCLPCFRLKTGQVSEPIQTPKGFVLFRRVDLDLIQVRHILISYEGAHESTQTRSREDARGLAEQLLKRARQGEDFAALAREHSDSASAGDGGLIGEMARGMTVPAFDHAAFSLEVGEISNVTLSPSGYQIIQRIQ
jgi:cyclophilin family peptidyl-prolyl cis-trans isomerase